MKFRYQAYDSRGASRSAVVEAASAAEATEQLRKEGLFVAAIESLEAAGAAARRRGGMGLGTSRVKCVAAFTRQMAVLVATGTRIADALVALEKQSRDAAFCAVVASVRRRVEEGAPLSDALSAHPSYFDSIAVSLVRAGESAGKLDAMLERLSHIVLAELRVRQTIAGAMVYPCLLLFISFSVLTTMMVFVLPRFTGLFATLGVPLPPTTRALMFVSGVLTSYWWAILAAAVGGAVGATMWVRSSAGRAALDTALVRLPVLGRMTRSFATARVCRVLGLLLDARVPLLESLELTESSLKNQEYRRLLQRARDAVQRGDPLSLCLAHGGLVDAGVVEALKNGERTGQSGVVLSSMADFIEEENRTLVKTLTSVVEPLILITLGVVVGLIAMSMFLPLFDLTASAGGGGGGS